MLFATFRDTVDGQGGGEVGVPDGGGAEAIIESSYLAHFTVESRLEINFD